jgi:hypothetical protein
MFTIAEKYKWELLQTKYPSPKCRACNQENETEMHFWKECKERGKTRERIEEKVKKKNRAKKINERITDLWEIECKEHHRDKELETLRKTTKWEAWADFYKVRNRPEKDHNEQS